jgi:hypothetical protein
MSVSTATFRFQFPVSRKGKSNGNDPPLPFLGILKLLGFSGRIGVKSVVLIYPPFADIWFKGLSAVP